MLKSSLNLPFQPVQTTLLSSIQRAKQRIFSKSIKTQTQNQNNIINNNNHQTIKRENDQNNSLAENVPNKELSSYPSIQRTKTFKNQLIPSTSQNSQSIKIKRDKSITQITTQNQSIKVNNPLGMDQQSNAVAVNAIKLLQQKIHKLQNKNKLLEQQLSQKTQHFTHQKTIPHQEQQQSDLKSYLLLKQQCESLQKQNASLCEELSKQKDLKYMPLIKQAGGRKLNFHHQISQNVSHLFVSEDKSHHLKDTQYEQQLKSLTQQIQKSQQQSLQFKLSLQNEKKRNFTILKLHQEEIIKNQELQLQLTQIKQKLKEYQQAEKNQSKNGKRQNASERRNSANNASNNLMQQTANYNSRPSAMMKQNQHKLQQTISSLRQQLEQEKQVNQQRVKQNTEIYQKYIQVKQAFIELYKDLLKYHPQVVNANIKFLYERIRKGEDLMLRSRSIMGYSRYGVNNRLLQTKIGQNRSNTNMRLSEFRSKSGKKGLKMEDLNSSKRSHSRERTNSKNSNRSVSKSKSKSGYRSPYSQQNLTKRHTSKSVLSPNPKQLRHKSITDRTYLANKTKLTQIQKIIKEIKQVSRQIKAIKSQHRNLSVKINTTQHIDNLSPSQEIKNQQRMNQLIEEYNQKNAKLQQLKLEKDRLALETVPDGLL